MTADQLSPHSDRLALHVRRISVARLCWHKTDGLRAARDPWCPEGWALRIEIPPGPPRRFAYLDPRSLHLLADAVANAVSVQVEGDPDDVNAVIRQLEGWRP